MPTRQSGSPRQQCTGVISAFLLLTNHPRMIHESKTSLQIDPNDNETYKFLGVGQSDGIIKGSIEPTHRSVCSDAMDVLKLQSTKAN